MPEPEQPINEEAPQKTSVGFVSKPIKTGKKSKHFSTRLKIFIGFVLLSAGAVMLVGSIIWWYLGSFSQAAQMSLVDLKNQIQTGLTATPSATDGRTNILVLGIDEIVGQKEGSLLTDTILVASYSHPNKSVTLVSLPRDLWIDPLKTKINALYYYGQLNNQGAGTKLVSSVAEQVTGLPIHYTLVVNLNSLQQIIDAVGGVDLDVPESFTDNHFPRSDVDIHAATSEAELYETVSFNQGRQHMDGATALKYIRTRESTNLDQGNDLAREDRQRALISALVAKLGSPGIFKHPDVLGSLLYIYNHDFVTNLGISELVSLAKLNGPHTPKLNSIQIPVEENGHNGLIFHPPTNKYKQWVFEPADPTWHEINQFIKARLSSQ